MVKKSSNRFRNARSKTSKKQKQLKKMYGGMFSDANRIELGQLGFSNQDIGLLETNIPNISLIRGSLQQINPETGALFTPQELMQGLHDAMNEPTNILDMDSVDNENENELNISGISNVSDDDHFLDENNDLNASFMNNDDTLNTTRSSISNLNGSNDNMSFQSDGSLHLSDLDDSEQHSINTTKEDNSFGGKKRRTMKKRNPRKSKKHTKKHMKKQNKKSKSVKKH